MTALVTGYTDVLDESFFRHAFDSPVVVYSPTQNRSIKEHIRWVKASPEITYSDLLNTHDFDRVIYISNTLDPTGDGSWDIGDLRTCLHSLKKQSGVKFVYIGSNRVLQDDDNSQKVVCQSFEDLCTFFRNNRGVETLMVRSPYLCNPSSSVDFLYRAFEELEMEGSYTMPGRPEQLSNCMSIQDLADLLHRLFVDWRSEIEVIDLIPPKGESYRWIAEEIKKILPGSTLDFSDDPVTHIQVDEHHNVARDFYDWKPSVNPLSQLELCLDAYRRARGAKPPLNERLNQWFQTHRKLVIAVETIIGAILVQTFNTFFSTGMQFRMIDLRLLYIVLIATAYGVFPGLLASLLMCASLAQSYMTNGLDAASLFFWYENWVPFILYIALGGAVGYAHTKQEEDNQFVKHQNEILTDRSNYLRSLYDDSQRIKETYRSELIQSQSGFGKVYDVVQRLSVFEQGEIFLQSVPIIEDVLSCDSVAIFTVDDKSADFARLQVCSEGVRNEVPTSIDLVKKHEIINALTEEDVWVNRGLVEDMPDYVACIRDQDKLRVLITLRNVSYEQMNVYYLNQIRVLVRLMGNFLVKAWEYQKANLSANYIGDTIIMPAKRFNEQLSYARSMQQRRLATYRLLRLKTHGETIEQLDSSIHRFVRSSDFLGIGMDGNLYLLAMQVTDETEHFLIDRFRSLGWDCDFIRDERVTI